MAGRLQPYSAAGLRAGGRSRRKSIEPVSTETSRQPRPCSSPPPPPRPGPPPRPRHSRPLIPCRSPESGVGRTPAYSIEIGGSRHYFRLIRRLSKDDTGALSIEDFDRNTVLVHRENSDHIERSAHLTELPCPISSQHCLLPLFYLRAGCWCIGGPTGRVHQTFRRSTIGLLRMNCG